MFSFVKIINTCNKSGLMKSMPKIQRSLLSKNAIALPQVYFTRKCSSTNKGNLVYEGPLKKRVKYVKILSLSSSMICFAMLPTVINDLNQISVALSCAFTVVSTAFLSTPFLLHWITKRYVIELMFNEESKTFTVKTFNIASQLVEFEFKAEDVTVPDIPGMLTSFLVKGKPLFVDPNFVHDLDAYSHMMGYDKPLDLLVKEKGEPKGL